MPSQKNQFRSESAAISQDIKFLGACILHAAAPKGELLQAIETAEKLAALFGQHQNSLAALDRWAREHVEIEVSWGDGVRLITKESRQDRAERKFAKLLKDKRASHFKAEGLNCSVINPELQVPICIKRRPSDWKARGFTSFELEVLQQFADYLEFSFFQAKNDRIRALPDKNQALLPRGTDALRGESQNRLTDFRGFLTDFAARLS